MQSKYCAPVVLALLAGCSVAPPIPLEEDPHYAEVALPPGRALLLRLTVAPLTGRALDLSTPRWHYWEPPPPSEDDSEEDETSEWLMPSDEEPDEGELEGPLEEEGPLPNSDPAPAPDPAPPVQLAPPSPALTGEHAGVTC